MVTLPDDSTVLGEVVDLSSHGAGLVLPIPRTRLPLGTRVSLLIEAHDLPDPEVEGGGELLSVRGVIAQVHKSGSTGPTRFGVAFAPVSRPLVERRLAARARLAGGTGAANAIGDGGREVELIGPGQAATAVGRERIFQHALELLARGQAERVPEVIGWAIAADPRNQSYLAVCHVGLAQRALDGGDGDAARREGRAAQALAPSLPEVLALVQRLGDNAPPEAEAPKGFFARLFGR